MNCEFFFLDEAAGVLSLPNAVREHGILSYDWFIISFFFFCFCRFGDRNSGA